MAGVPRYKEMRGNMSCIKQLFQTRHYNQCIAVCERLLASNKQVHPLHQAYLHFYLALSHDTMAREAGMRDKDVELELAEKHYLAAIAALAPSEPHHFNNIKNTDSPTSSDEENDMYGRRASDTASLQSCHSTSTAATLVDDTGDEPTGGSPSSKRSVTFFETTFSSNNDDTPRVAKPKLPPLNTRSTSPTPSPSEWKPSVDLSSLTKMFKSHLAGVHALKETPTAIGHRYSSSRFRQSVNYSRPLSRESNHEGNEMEQIRWQRKSLRFRPRFDPTSVQKLCAEALDEL